jgi:hypothetical protein
MGAILCSDVILSSFNNAIEQAEADVSNASSFISVASLSLDIEVYSQHLSIHRHQQVLALYGL